MYKILPLNFCSVYRQSYSLSSCSWLRTDAASASSNFLKILSLVLVSPELLDGWKSATPDCDGDVGDSKYSHHCQPLVSTSWSSFFVSKSLRAVLVEHSFTFRMIETHVTLTRTWLRIGFVCLMNGDGRKSWSPSYP